MRLDGQRESRNIENRRGQSGRGLPGGGPGAAGLGRGVGGFLPILLPFILSRFGILGVVIVVGGLFALQMCSAPLIEGPAVTAPPAAGNSPAARGATSALESETDRFVARVLGSTEDTWDALFREAGERYQPPTLVLFEGSVRSACGSASSASGPFYCPADRRVYLDTAFFDQLARRFGAPGDFAAAYVIAHEVGHHIQTITGTAEEVRRLQARARRAEANQLSVRMELQADCYAGVWASRNRQLLDEGDFAEGVRAAEAIGDDTLQRSTQGHVVPDSFTHGTSEQRVRWLTRGFRSGDPQACDTFGPPFAQL